MKLVQAKRAGNPVLVNGIQSCRYLVVNYRNPGQENLKIIKVNIVNTKLGAGKNFLNKA